MDQRGARLEHHLAADAPGALADIEILHMEEIALVKPR